MWLRVVAMAALSLVGVQEADDDPRLYFREGWTTKPPFEAQIRFRSQVIGSATLDTGLTVIDLDDDGKPDILAGGVEPAWFQNPNWKRRPIGGRARSAAAGIGSTLGWVNGIRRLAVVEAGGLNIYEQPTKPFEPQRNTLPRATPVADAPWERDVLAREAGVSALGWADFDADGSDELAVSSSSGLDIFKRWYDGAWRSTRVDTGSALALASGDLNGDGLPELILGGKNGTRILWNESQPRWVRHVIVRGFRTQSAVAADFTGRGRMDVISGDIEKDRHIFLYAAPDWKPTLLKSGIRLIQSAALDIDGDGDIDFIGAQYRPGRIFWLEQPANPLGEAWPFHVIDDFSTNGVNGVHGLLLADIDRDGKLDLVGNSGWPDGSFPNSLAWFRIPPEPRTAARWERYIFADRDAPGLSHYLGGGDINGDGRLDLASGAKIGPDGNWFAWWEQPSDSRKPWTKRPIARDQEGATNIVMADLNGDGKPDFVASRGHGQGLVWYEAPDWKAHEIYPTLAGPHSLAAADIDGDGDVDFATCAKDARIAAWFENDGEGRFAVHHIHEDQAAYEIRLVDMDGDQDLDMLVAGQESQNVVWFENRLKVGHAR